MTHYITLDIAQNARDEDVKRAYRKMAMKHHPDRHPGGDAKHAEVQFKKVQEAYRILSDGALRSKYDNELQWAKTFGSRTMYRAVSTKHLDAYTVVRIPASEWYEGGLVMVPLPAARWNQCTDCRGVQSSRCVHCFGLGGRVQTHVRTFLGARANYGKYFKLTAEGHTDANGYTGDLYFQLQVQGLDDFYLDGYNLRTSVRIPAAILRFGGQWEIAMVRGKALSITVPPGMKPQGKLRLAGFGVLRDSFLRGDLLVQVQPAMPQTFKELFASWGLHAKLGLRYAASPLVAWWRTPATP